jgi:hypothetical protein
VVVREAVRVRGRPREKQEPRVLVRISGNQHCFRRLEVERASFLRSRTPCVGRDAGRAATVPSRGTPSSPCIVIEPPGSRTAGPPPQDGRPAAVVLALRGSRRAGLRGLRGGGGAS